MVFDWRKLRSLCKQLNMYSSRRAILHVYLFWSLANFVLPDSSPDNNTARMTTASALSKVFVVEEGFVIFDLMVTLLDMNPLSWQVHANEEVVLFELGLAGNAVAGRVQPCGPKSFLVKTATVGHKQFQFI